MLAKMVGFVGECRRARHVIKDFFDLILPIAALQN
jgi:hypothetical protein